MSSSASKARYLIPLILSLAIVTILTVAIASSKHLSEVAKNTPASPHIEAAGNDDTGFPFVDWDYWLAVNPHIVGWITVPGTDINTPIVGASTQDPHHYLRNDIYGNWNPHGAAYLSAACEQESLFSPNAVIYAHNMGYGEGIFAAIAEYNNPSFALEHPTILIQTPQEKRELTVYFSELSSGDAIIRHTTFVDQNDFISWFEERLDHASVVLKSEIPSADQNLFSLVTCSYNQYENERTIVYAL